VTLRVTVDTLDDGNHAEVTLVHVAVTTVAGQVTAAAWAVTVLSVESLRRFCELVGVVEAPVLQ
jgi:hypothetical protein